MPFEPLATAFGISAAVLLVGGGMVLRYQRDRQHFALMEKALEKGITTYQGMVPGWLISLRIGMLCFVLGVGLMGSGVAARELADAGDGRPALDRSVTPPPGYRDTTVSSAPAERGGVRDAEGPPPPSPEMEKWRQAQMQQAVGLCAICAGAILVMLGVVRMAFAGLEKKYLVALEAGAKE